jgi:tetratricopeptide (TPR) repeat protein
VREGLAKIGSFYLNEAQVIYLPQKRNKEAAISYGKSYDVFSLPVMGRIDTMSAYNAGYISIMEEDFENAAKYLGELEKVGYYKDGDVYYYLYYAYHSLGNEEKANEYMMKGSDKFPAHKELTNLRINLYIQSNRDINEIIAEIDEAIAKDPKNNAYYYYKAMMLEKNNDMEGALAMFKQVLEFTPNDFSANFNTGVLYSRQAEKLRQVLNEIPYKEQERYDKTLKEMESNYLESVKYYEKALEIQPANLDVLEVLKNIYFYFRDKQDGMMSKYETIKAKIDAMSADANMTQQRLQSM